MKIQVYIRKPFGTERIYPVDDIAKQLCKLTGTKTLTSEHMKIIRSMGIVVSVVGSDFGCEKTERRIGK